MGTPESDIWQWKTENLEHSRYHALSPQRVGRAGQALRQRGLHVQPLVGWGAD